MSKVEVVKSSNTVDKPNYVWVIFTGAFIGLGIIMAIISIVSNSDTPNSKVNEYLKAPLSDCPEYTLQDGINRIVAVYDRNNINFSYKVEEGTSRTGKKLMYLKMYNMYGLYNTDVYLSMEMVNGKVSIGTFVYEINGPVLQNSNNIKALLCNQ